MTHPQPVTGQPDFRRVILQLVDLDAENALAGIAAVIDSRLAIARDPAAIGHLDADPLAYKAAMLCADIDRQAAAAGAVTGP